MDPIPSDIVIENLPGPKRGVHPTLYFRDEIVWSPSKIHFALAYTIAEASMMNEIGCVLWGSFRDGSSSILGNPEQLYTCCWYSPWCVWLDDGTFVFKAQMYDGKTTHTPVVVLNIEKGFAVLPGTDNPDSRPTQVSACPGPFRRGGGREILRAIVGAHS